MCHEEIKSCNHIITSLFNCVFMGGSRGGGGELTGGPDPPPPEKSQKYRVSQQYWSRSTEKSQATKPATFNVGPPSTPSETPFGGPMMVACSGIYILSSHQQKNVAKVRPPLKKLSGSTHAIRFLFYIYN